MSRDTKIGIVTAAGYTEAERYYGRLHGLLEAIKATTLLTPAQKQNIIIMGTLFSLFLQLSYYHLQEHYKFTNVDYRRRIKLSLHLRPHISLPSLPPIAKNVDPTRHAHLDTIYHYRPSRCR